MRCFPAFLALLVLFRESPESHAFPSADTPHRAAPASGPQSSATPSRAEALLQGIDRDLRVLDKTHLADNDKKQRDHAKSVAQKARRLLQDARSDNDAEALSMATTASKEVGAIVRRELKLDRLLSAAERYRAGDTIPAVEDLTDTLTSDLGESIRYLEANRDRLGVGDTGLADVNDMTLAALALAETEAAFRNRNHPGARLACVRQLLGVVNAGRLPERFVERWYVAVAGHLQGQMLVLDAVVHVEEAFRRCPKDPEVLLAAGMFYELMASPGVQLPARDEGSVSPTIADVRLEPGTRKAASASSPDGSNDGYDRLVVAKKKGLSRAEELYRGALALNGDYAEAHLRLGRVLFMNARSDDALGELRLAAASTDHRIQYLASMFQGAVQEAATRFDAAVACYQEAHRTCPRCLSAGLALSHAQRRSGDASGSAQTLNAAMQRDASTPAADPWWDYPRGALWQRDMVIRDLRGGLR